MPRPGYVISPKAGGDGIKPWDGAPTRLTGPRKEEARNIRRIAHSDLNGWGDSFQIQVRGGYCYVARSGYGGEHGLTILDVSDPRKPRIVNQIADKPGARTHKILLVDDLLITNSEGVPGMEDPEFVGGLRLFDLRDPANPRFVNYVDTQSRGIHRPIYDRARNLLYCSAFKEGFRGKILQVYDMKDPFAPALLGEGWIEGQHVAGGERPSWDFDLIGWGCWLHEANPYGNYLTCGFWDGGIALFDLTDPARPVFMWRHNPYETHGWPAGYHSFLVPPGSEFAIVTTEAVVVNCQHPPAFVTFYDMRNVHHPLPVSTYHPYPIDPITLRPQDASWCETGSIYGAHNIWLDMRADDLMFICWYSGGLRVVDWSNPFAPKEMGYYIPAGTPERWTPQTNDVCVDRATGLIYTSDYWGLGLNILEYSG